MVNGVSKKLQKIFKRGAFRLEKKFDAPLAISFLDDKIDFS
jgi:hypothetical protein